MRDNHWLCHIEKRDRRNQNICKEELVGVEGERVRENNRVAWEGYMITVYTVREDQMMPACKAAWALDHQDIVGYGHFEVDTGRAGCRGLPFEDGSDALANGSVRLALFPGTKQPSARGQLEGRLGTQNDRGHSAGPFILPWDPMVPPRPWRPSLLSAALPFEPVQEFGGVGGPLGLCITFTALFPLSILPSSGGKNVMSQFAQITYSVVKIVNNERERERCT